MITKVQCGCASRLAGKALCGITASLAALRAAPPHEADANYVKQLPCMQSS